MTKKQFVLYLTVTLLFLGLLNYIDLLAPSNAMSSGYAKEVRASSFILVDGQGREVGGMLAKDGLVLIKIGSKKTNSIELCAGAENGCAAFFMDGNNKTRIKLGLLSGGDASLQISHSNNVPAITMLASEEQRLSGINIQSPVGKNEVVLMSKHKASTVGLVDHFGAARATLMCTPKFGSGWSIMNKEGRGEITAVVTDNGPNKLVIQKESNDEIIVAGVGEKGAQFRMHGKGGQAEGNLTVGLLGRNPWMDLTGPNGKKIVSVLSEKGKHFVTVFDNGRPVWQIPK